MRNAVWIAIATIVGTSSGARAEGPTQPPPEQSSVQIVEQPAGAVTVQQQEPQRGGRGIEYGGHIVIPAWTGDEGDTFSVGGGLQGRVGWEFGSFTAELNIGFQVSPYADPLLSDFTLNAVWLGAGVRYAFFNPSALVPFVGAGLKANFWTASYTDPFTGEVTTSEKASGTLGLVLLAGVAYEVTPDIAIELGIEVNGSSGGDVFVDEDSNAHDVMWVSPFIGATLYYD